MNRLYLYLFCWLCLVSNIWGQDYLFNVRQLSVEEGMLGRRINSITQDDEGFMWIATNEGLNRFDGYRFEHYTKASHGLNSNNIRKIVKDDEGDIWIGYNQDRFIMPKIQIWRPRENRLLSIKEKLGAGYQPEYESLRVNKNSFEEPILMFINGSKENKLETSHAFLYQNEKLESYPYTNLLLNPKTKQLQVSNRVEYYTLNDKYEIIDTIELLGSLKETTRHFTKNGGLFVYTRSKDKGTLYHKKDGVTDFQAVITVGQQNRLRNLSFGYWIEDVLYFEHKSQLKTYNTKEILDRAPRLIYIDNQDNVWIGTNKGVYILSISPNYFKIYLKNANTNKKGKNTLYDGRGLWATADNLYTFSSDGNYRVSLQDNQTERILKPLSDNSNNLSVANSNTAPILWIGNKRGQLLKFNRTTKELEATIEGRAKQIWSLYEDKNGRVWIGYSEQYGLGYYEPNRMDKIEKYNQLNGFKAIQKGKTLQIIPDRRDNNYLWLACQSGWYRLHIEEGLKHRYWSEAAPDFNIPTDEVHFIHQDDEGIFWLATASSGLLRVALATDFTVKSVKQLTVTDGLTSNTVNAIFEDDNNYLWMSTNNGINRVDKSTYEVQAFLEEDGLPHYEFNRISHFQQADGTIFFGSLNGIVSFHPKVLKSTKTYDVPLKISKFEKYSEDQDKMLNATAEVLTHHKIVIHPNERLATLFVAIQDYFDAPKTRYIYRIKGVQRDFSYANNNEIPLNGLPYGTFTLEVKAKGQDGRFSEQIISIPLMITRPFYLQWWFISLIIIGLLLSIWQLFQARTSVLQARKRELEEIVKDRTAQLQHQATQLQLDKNTIEIQAKELRSLDEMKSRFFANISHELRTPLTLILSPAQSILNRKRTDNRDFTSAQIIEQNAQKLLKRINEILDLTKLEAQEMKLKPQPTPFYEFIKRLVATFESLAAQKNQQLSFQYQLDKDLTLQLDQDKYEHIFNNYLSNAIKYTPKAGMITVQLTEKAVKNEQNQTENYIVLAVKDNGQGILAADMPKIFDRFFQSKNDQNKKGSSGIGLALAKEIAQLMKGKVLVESTIGEGSAFYFEMPYIEELGVTNYELRTNSNLNIENQATKAPMIFDNTSTPSAKRHHHTILLVEDNTQLRNYIQLILQDTYHVITAEHGKEALDKLEIKEAQEIPNSKFLIPNLIISDIMMPIMDGFELLERLKASAALRHIPVVMLTARSNAKDKLRALRIGVDDYILKPFEEEELLVRIDNLIRNVKGRTVVNENENRNENDNGNGNDNLTGDTSLPKAVTAVDLKWLEKVEEQLKAEVSNSKFNIDSLAEVMNLSRGHLHRRIKTITGLTPNKYFRAIKLQTAREILESGEAQTVSEVCYAVGFDTPKYFSKVYQERFGKKPIEYLK